MAILAGLWHPDRGAGMCLGRKKWPGDNCRNQGLFAQVLNGNFLQQINSHGRSLDENGKTKGCHNCFETTIRYLVVGDFLRNNI